MRDCLAQTAIFQRTKVLSSVAEVLGLVLGNDFKLPSTSSLPASFQLMSSKDSGRSSSVSVTDCCCDEVVAATAEEVLAVATDVAAQPPSVLKELLLSGSNSDWLPRLRTDPQLMPVLSSVVLVVVDVSVVKLRPSVVTSLVVAVSWL